MSNDTEFKIFVDSQLHGVDWPKESCAVVSKDVFSTQKPFVVRSQSHGAHSEQMLIKQLEKRLKPENGDVLPTKRRVPLTLFSNYSPCSECSRCLIEFIDDCKKFNLEISLEVVFSGIYKIARPSCKRGDCGKNHEKLNHVKENIAGLKSLIQHGAKLRTFEEKDWRDLASILELPEERVEEAIRKREEEDIRMRQDLKELLPEVSPAGRVSGNDGGTQPVSLSGGASPQTPPDLVAPMEALSLSSPRSCPPTQSARSESMATVTAATTAAAAATTAATTTTAATAAATATTAAATTTASATTTRSTSPNQS